MNNQNVNVMSMDELDEIINHTEYAESGVTIGDGAAADQDLRRAAQKEIGRRIYGDIA